MDGDYSMVSSALGTMKLWKQQSRFLVFPFVARFLALLPAGILCACSFPAYAKTIDIPSGTPLSVELFRHSPMKTGEPLEGRLVYPVFVENRMALPAGSILYGRVVGLERDRNRRIHAGLHGDFTPFRIPIVQFDHVAFENAAPEPITCDNAKDGMLVLRLSTPSGQKKGSFIGRQWGEAKRKVRETVTFFTAPGRGDRFLQFAYAQLPYHPQRIETGTTWTVDLAQPLRIDLHGDPEASEVNPAPARTPKPADSPNPSKRIQDQPPPEWQLRAYLQRTLSSAKDKPGDTFEAYVAEPVFNPGHTLVVPEGSLLIGEVTQSKPARSFGRQGKLRFHFKELKFPAGFSEPVEGLLAGVNSDKSANLQIDPEGGIEARVQNRILAPAFLSLLAGRAFDSDENRTINHGLASNGLGLAGRVVGMAIASRNVAAGIGFYGAAVSFYDLWLARGRDVVFAKGTRIEVTTTPRLRHLKPVAHSH
jgi:hypothetical protein